MNGNRREVAAVIVPRSSAGSARLLSGATQSIPDLTVARRPPGHPGRWPV